MKKEMPEPINVTILGGGSWGMALAAVLHKGNNRVTLWEFDSLCAERLSKERSIPERLPNFFLPDGIKVTASIADSVETSELVVLATPSQVMRSVLEMIPSSLRSNKQYLNVAKGIETGSLLRMSEVIHEVTAVSNEGIATLSGPSHAEEVVRGVPTTVVVASVSSEFAQFCQQALSVSNFRVYSNDDLIGVELGGSLKNVIAIAAGIIDGLKLGDNTRGALITRGLAEITRLGMVMGADAETFAGLSGIGDLVTTAVSRHSRNRYVGEQIGKGRKLSEILSEMSMVAEGIETTRSACSLAEKHSVDMPIAKEVYNVLFEDKPAAEALRDLMERELKTEVWK